MNIENINTLIDALKNGLPNVKFDMRNWLVRTRNCGTVACIAGHVLLLQGGEVSFFKADTPLGRTMEWLDIDFETARRLCVPSLTTEYARLTPQDAVYALEQLRDTGEVDWPDHCYVAN